MLKLCLGVCVHILATETNLKQPVIDFGILGKKATESSARMSSRKKLIKGFHTLEKCGMHLLTHFTLLPLNKIRSVNSVHL